MLKSLSLVVREINSNRHTTIEYVNLNIYVLDYLNDRPIKILFKHTTFVINDLRTKILIEMNVLVFEDIDLIIFTRIDHIESCDITFQLFVTPSARSFIKQEVILERSIFISARSHLTVIVEHISLFAEKDFIFEPVKKCSITLFAVIVNLFFHVVLTRNDLD